MKRKIALAGVLIFVNLSVSADDALPVEPLGTKNFSPPLDAPSYLTNENLSLADRLATGSSLSNPAVDSAIEPDEPTPIRKSRNHPATIDARRAQRR
jgi:hypothetical protein